MAVDGDRPEGSQKRAVYCPRLRGIEGKMIVSFSHFLRRSKAECKHRLGHHGESGTRILLASEVDASAEIKQEVVQV